MRKIFIAFIVIILGVIPAFAGAPSPGEQAPGFSLQSMEGSQVALSDFKGKVVLIGMFHICVPCMNQAMEFNKVRDQLGDKQVVILGINTNRASENYCDEFSQLINLKAYYTQPIK